MDANLIVMPVYNEAPTLVPVIKCLSRNYEGAVLFVDDGSSDGTAAILQEAKIAGPLLRLDIKVLTHPQNRGYGKSLIDGFNFAWSNGFESVVTMDCDWQHEPAFVSALFKTLPGWDVISGSRYLKSFDCDAPAPADRGTINKRITALINNLTGFRLTDSFCGFKAYRTEALRRLTLNEPGYGMPLQFWIQAFHFGLRVRELPVPRIYPYKDRRFGEEMDDPEKRFKYYLAVMQREKDRWGIRAELMEGGRT